MRITVLGRGGLSVYGGEYDAHRNEAIALVRSDETLAVVIEFPSAPTSPSTSTSGATASAPTVSGNDLSLTLTDLVAGGRVDVLATVGGAVRKIRIRIRSQVGTDRYECGPDLVGA